MMTIPQHLNSLLVRLEHASALELDHTLRELLGYPDALDQVVQIVDSRIDAGAYVCDEPLASLISQTRSSRLYEKVRERWLKNPGTVLTLYKGKYPDPEIEKELCSRLYKIAPNDGEPLRRFIVDAMREVGSEAVLPTLEAILFDLEPSAQIRQVFSDALGPMDGLKAVSRAEFVKHVALAIEDIKSRAASAVETVMSGTPEDETTEQVDETNNASRNRKQAQLYIDVDPEAAIMYIRRGAEALAKDLYRRLGHEQKGKPARKLMLEDLLKFVKDSDVPEVFKLLVQTFQLFGNFAMHDQDEQSIHLTKEVASALLALYDQALSIYSVWSANTE